MLEMLEYEFMKTAFLAGIVIAVMGGLTGIFVVLRKLSFLTDGIAHFSLVGVAAAIATGSSIIAWTFASALFGAVLIERIRSGFRLSADASVGVLLPIGLSLGVIILSAAKITSIDLASYLFGSILAIPYEDLALISTLGVATIVTIIYFHRQFLYISYDEEGAQASGMNVRLYNLILIAAAGIAAVLTIRVAGILLASSIMVIPAASALQFNFSFRKTAMLSCIFALASVLVGITFSYYLGIPTGAAIAFCSFVLFLLSAALASKVKNL
ncbi:MAG: metal ABC transporter permease [Candidatus Anstonellaceae archaeon]